MTIRSSPPVSLSDVMVELRVTSPGRAYPISLGDADVRALAGVLSGPISLSDLYGKSSMAPLTATGSGASNFANTGSSSGTVSCSPSVTPSGGSGGYTYQWSFTSNPNACSLAGAASQSCTVSHSYSRYGNGSASATLQCVITDSGGRTTTVTGIPADLTWESAA
jgi:hypothetical protein